MALSDADRRWFLQEIQRLDPNGSMVQVVNDGARLLYSDIIRSDETRLRLADPEELVRALTLCILCSDKYGYSPERMHLEQTHSIGRPSTSTAQIDLILYFAENDGSETVFAMWEMKAPDEYKPDADPLIEDQLFNTAPLVSPSLLVYSTIKPGTPDIECITVDYKAHKAYGRWNATERPATRSFPPRYQLPSFRPYRKAPGSPDLDANATTADFRAVARSFHSEFFAEHPDTEIYSNIVKLLLAKIYDERMRRPNQQYDFQVLQVAGSEEPAATLFERISSLYEQAYSAYVDPRNGDSLDSKDFSPERVKSVVKGLQGLAITKGAALHGDVIGAFFEEILRAGFKQDKGMYFTHANLVWFMLEAIDLKQLTKDTWRQATHPNNRMPYVVDPSCGSGTFLLRAMQMMSSAIRDDRAELVATQDDERYYQSHLSDLNPNEWAKDFLYGSDPKFVMAITAKVNMVLHGDGSAHIYPWDALRPLSDGPDRRLQPVPTGARSTPQAIYKPELSEQFDVVVSNPPFGITLAPETSRTMPETFALGNAASSESLFIERYHQLLRPKGRLAVVVPESLLNAAEYRNSRLLLYRFFWIRAVVSLPRNLFVETPTLTSLLFAQKKEASQIAQWDASWSTATSTVTTAVKQAQTNAKKAARAKDASSTDVQQAFVSSLAPHIDASSFVLRRGRGASAVLPLQLPPDITTAPAALSYYERMVKAAGFQGLCTRAIFNIVTAAIPNDWPVYAVDEVGYKLSKRGEKVRPNQLCAFMDQDGKERPNVQRNGVPVDVVVDETTPVKVLDFLRRDVKWA